MHKPISYIVPKQFEHIAHKRGQEIAMRHKKYGIWQETTWASYYHQAEILAAAFISAGVEHGDMIGIISENCPEWLIVDMATQMVGATTVGIYTTNSWEQVHYVVDHARCKILFAQDEEQVDKWLRFQNQTPFLNKIIYWEEDGLRKVQDSRLTSWDLFIASGREHLSEARPVIASRIQELSEDDTAILVYTSGTTGRPKAAMLTHKNLIWSAESIATVESGSLVRVDEEIMSFLPLCHIFERTFSVYLHLVVGYTISFVESMDTLPINLKEIHPTIGYAVPRIWEKYHARITIDISDADWLKRKVYQQALDIGRKYVTASERGDAGIGLKALYRLAHSTVFYWIKERLGMDRMRYALSGAAPISPEVLRFFQMIGLTIVEGYGMTETSAVITMSSPKAYRHGTVGLPVPGSQFKIAEDGEILTKHPGVFKGYYLDEDATNDTLVDGWMHTGDIGSVDEDGYVSIIDRKKDLIITAGGKNIAPQFIENKLKYSPYINDAVIIGDRRKFISAIVVLDEENINKFAQDHKVQYSTYADLSDHADIMALIDREVKKVNKTLANVQRIRKFKILNKRLYQEDGEMTPTLKVKRKYINETYSELIESIYT